MPNSAMQSRWLAGNLMISEPEIGPGNYFYVDSTNGAAGNTGLTWSQAMATIDQAVNKCTASNGDKIIVAPYHAENLAADSAVDVDVAGVEVIGLRSGQLRPTLTNTAEAGDFKLAAAGCSVRGIRFSGGIDVGTGIIEVSADDCSIIDCEYVDTVGEATDVIMGVAASHLLIDGFEFRGAAAAGANSAIALNACPYFHLKNFSIYGNFAVGAVDFRTAASTLVKIHSGKIWTANAADLAIMDTITGSTGFIGPDLQIMLADNAANITTAVTGATFVLFDPVYVCNLAGEKGMLINWTASTHA